MSRSATANPPYAPRFQWEASSGTFDCSQSNNCGPTGSTQQDDYYLGSGDNVVRFGIEDTRVLAADRCRSTNAWEQAEMLVKRGVPAKVANITSIEELATLVGDGHRPVGIGVLMSRLTAKTRGHDFLGWHRVTILANRKRYDAVVGKRVRGFTYTDPNFHPTGSGYREDPKKGHRWVSRRELDYAFVQNSPAYAIVPERAKA